MSDTNKVYFTGMTVGAVIGLASVYLPTLQYTVVALLVVFIGAYTVGEIGSSGE